MRTSIAHAAHGAAPKPRHTAAGEPTFVPPLDIARDNARRVLTEAQELDLDTATVGEVYGQRGALQESLRQVLAALDAEDGRDA
ncbi:hypothetical protein [Streptomyces cylindrosporus]|uniref:Uncharacterized protein n=1 Tax=Streptomyces cylindrosporus TaxID=2927583 RepID=A0ABS9YJP0_9ACTN|nr:hypothetical protein [Streptomyces cylindrosporus]MCI3277460.1 hypothetical protein [Streptomyces cylindrosporus]